MTLTGLPPSIDPAQRNSLFGTVQFIIDKMIKQEMDDILPCKVVAFDRHANRVSVQILITMIDTANKQVQRAQIAEVPVLQLGGGGFVLSFPIRAGDLGWIKATDVDISLFLQKAIISPPNTKIMHKFDSAIFIPDTMLKGVTIAGGDASNVVLQSLDGTVKISLGAAVEILPHLGVGAAPRAGAIIDAQTTTAAVGIPAMTSTQKASIPSPQLGYLVFDTTLDRLSVYASGGWS